MGGGQPAAAPSRLSAVRNHLRALREERAWTQAVLADRLEVSRQTVNALETGRYDPSLPLAFRIARIFDCAIEDVFQPEDSPAATDPSASTSAGRKAR